MNMRDKLFDLLAQIGLVLVILGIPAFVMLKTWSDYNHKQNIKGNVYLISISGKVKISDFKGLAVVENGYNVWYDKNGLKHWTKAPVMFEKEE